jgi:RNA-binding protein YhbY
MSIASLKAATLIAVHSELAAMQSWCPAFHFLDPQTSLKLIKSSIVMHYSFRRSMREMLSAHKLVKIQLNNDPRHASSVACAFEEECNAKLVAIRGKILLMAEGTFKTNQQITK